MRKLMYVDALNEAIKEEMTRDESVYYMGEDVRASIYGASKDLFDMYGEKRVIDTPLSENGFFGAAIGSSLVLDTTESPDCVVIGHGSGAGTDRHPPQSG